jgi:PAS domain S-box-containing protein
LGNGEVEFDAAGTPLRSVGTVQDITERKKITEELFESQTTLTNIINSLPHSIFWKDRDGLYLGCNETFAREAGLDSPEEIIGKTDYDLPWSGHAADAYRRDDHEVIERNQSKRHIIEQVQTAAGPNIWVDTTKVPLSDDNGEIYGVLGIFEDITARKQIDDALRESEKELHSLAEAMPQIVWITRPDGWNVYLSQRWVDYTGLSLEESYGPGWIKPFHPDDQQRAWDAWQHAIQTGSPYALECRLRRSDGVYTWWLIRGIPLLDQQGNILKWFGTCTDIHELKKVEEELRENKAILQAALDNSPAGIAIADAPDGKLRYVNDSGLLIRGGDRESIVNGVGIDQYVASWQILDLDGTPLPAENVPLARAILFGEANSREFIVRRDSNDDRIVLGNAAPILDEDGKVRAAIVVFTDITERKQAEKKIEEQLDELRRWHNITLGREDRVLELKSEVNQLLEQAGLPPRYPSARFTRGS